jgi:hypothetical protein
MDVRLKRQQRPVIMPHLIRKLERVKRNSHGVTENGEWFPKGLPVWSYELVLLPSYSTYDTEYVRAKNAGDAKELIKAKYPNAESFDF